MFLRPCLRPVSLSAGRPVVLSSLLLALVLALSGGCGEASVLIRGTHTHAPSALPLKSTLAC